MNVLRSRLTLAVRRGAVISAGAALRAGAVLAPVAQAQGSSAVINTLSQFAGSADAAAEDGPRISVSKSVISEEGDTEIVVTGAGFDDDTVVGTRRPLLGKGAGIYVILGKFADEWKPSEDAPSANRTSISQFWAVAAEDMEAIGGAKGGAIELAEDGSFTATFTVSTALIEDEAGDAEGNLGIYTYPGSGATHAAWETFRPLTVGAPAASAELPLGSLGSLFAENPID